MGNSNAISEYIDYVEASQILNVSSATVRNWVKTRLLNKQKKSNKSLLLRSEVNQLNDGIVSGATNRLNKRANKSQSKTFFIPEEYGNTPELRLFLHGVFQIMESNKLSIDTVLFSLAVSFLKKNKLADFDELDLVFDSILFKHPSTQKALAKWQKNLLEKKISKELLALDIPETDEDLLGLVYQSIRSEGDKSKDGAYYTPKSVVRSIVKSRIKPSDRTLDPCCGTGQFLIEVARKIKNPKNVWVFDFDKNAVEISKVNLFLAYPKHDFCPNIIHLNTLTDTQKHTQKFDSVITNPPWGLHMSDTDTSTVKNIYPRIKSKESFSFFLDRGVQLLKDGGRLSFILPESFLKIKVHSDIRKILIEETTIENIVDLGRAFKNVFTPVLRLDITKQKNKTNHQIKYTKDDTNILLVQDSLKDNYSLNSFHNDKDLMIFEKIYIQKHTSLEGEADWALGIVTGNNKKYLLEEKTNGAEGIITGKNIKRYVTTGVNKYIEFNPDEMQQVAPMHKYRADEKLIYKFICKQLVFAYDNQKRLTLNSANIMIPNKNHYPIKTILALYNSSPYQFIYQKKFSALKALKGDIEKLPLPILSKKQHAEIENIVDKLLKKSSNKRETIIELYQELDNYIMKIFDFSKIEKDYILENIANPKTLLTIN